PANGEWRAAWSLPAGVDPGSARFELVLAGGQGVGLPAPRTRDLADPLRRRRMQALVDAYAAARRERDAALALAKAAHAARAEAAERAERAEESERGHRAVAGDARLALARAQRALATAEARASAAERRRTGELHGRASAERDAALERNGELEAAMTAERQAAVARTAELEHAVSRERERLAALTADRDAHARAAAGLRDELAAEHRRP